MQQSDVGELLVHYVGSYLLYIPQIRRGIASFGALSRFSRVTEVLRFEEPEISITERRRDFLFDAATSRWGMEDRWQSHRFGNEEKSTTQELVLGLGCRFGDGEMKGDISRVGAPGSDAAW